MDIFSKTGCKGSISKECQMAGIWKELKFSRELVLFGFKLVANFRLFRTTQVHKELKLLETA